VPERIAVKGAVEGDAQTLWLDEMVAGSVTGRVDHRAAWPAGVGAMNPGEQTIDRWLLRARWYT